MSESEFSDFTESRISLHAPAQRAVPTFLRLYPTVFFRPFRREIDPNFCLRIASTISGAEGIAQAMEIVRFPQRKRSLPA